MEKIKPLFDNPILIKLIYVILLFVVIFFAVRIIRKTTLQLIKDNSSKYRIKKLINFLGYLFFAFGILLIFNAQLSGIGTALGVAGAGIAFALQEVIVSIAGYIAIFTSNFYRVGDRVQLGGIKGDVIDVGMLRTTLMQVGDWVDGDLYNGKMVRVANSFVFKEPVYNYSGDFPFLWDEIKIPIKTIGDYTYAKELFFKILKEEVGDYANSSQKAWDKMIGKYSIENARVQPMISMSFNENWITFTLRYVVDYQSRRSTKSFLYDKILTAIKESKGKIEVASAAIEITAFPK
ncbi:mechanosensitive ion channel family protein [Aquimarina gracilis]|uniref:Mechanosensitive ion channel family protein n=1 Tax=Aquimarina gracilis TaxID=874422 RepID=A0ABU5ZU43_9FLAO|nr:mechanosensitive ion channel family protein [Aquimarina gracilis]MEB3345321.1 mechanosensitive ion channel family protein [Aquimarina gracilis]